MTPGDDIMRAMARLKKALERRMRLDDRAEELAAREARPIRTGELATYDSAALGRQLRPMLEFDGRGWRALAAEIGVTAPDLSRIMAGQDISAAKVFAICDWAGLDARKFYRRPAGAPSPRKRPRQGLRPAKRFHGKSTETAGAAAR
jgi:transcriptional regulator with XRE-family HTH domain